MTRNQHNPTRRLGTFVLIGLHLAAFATLRFATPPRDAAILFSLGNDSLHPAAILLYPFGATNILVLLAVLFTLAVLGTLVENRLGAAVLLTSYLMGTLFAGVFFFLFAPLSAAHSGLTLALPAGALAAWTFLARGAVRSEFTLRQITVPTRDAIGMAALGTVAIVFAYCGPAATGWILAAWTGGLAAPISRRLFYRRNRDAR